MIEYKGVLVDDEVGALVAHMPVVEATREGMHSLQGVWDTLSLLGGHSGAGVEIGSLRAAFADLSGPLLNQLARETRAKAVGHLQMQAQVSIDILVRNLFERTADIGFLATDEDLLRFVSADPSAREASRAAMVERLVEYRAKYTVYEDIVVIEPDGGIALRLRADEQRSTADGFVTLSMQTSAAYVETFATSDMWASGPRALTYSCPVRAVGGRPSAVLALRFAFEDECRRVFSQLLGPESWVVLVLQDASGVVIASSDPLQVPVGAVVQPAGAVQADVVRFCGRRWLSAACVAHPYQGYAGPGWEARAMTPLDHAFEEAAGDRHAVESGMLDALMRSSLLFGPELSRIPRAAEDIEVELNRAVWNGSIAGSGPSSGRANGSAAAGGFSKALLLEISRTGARTRSLFTAAIAQMHQAVLAGALGGVRARAALAIEIMDRNLYERANDCRWWALTSSFREALSAPLVEPSVREGLERTLQTIHGLYTVYSNLILFDAQGVVVAVSKLTEGVGVGARLAGDWVGRTLALRNAQQYAVSAFEPTALYGGKSTYVYSAAVCRVGRGTGAVGGIAIVFDGEPQFAAMLQDVVPVSQAAAREAAAFVTSSGQWLSTASSSTRGSNGGQPRLDLDMSVVRECARDGTAKVVMVDGELCAVGVATSRGYREYQAMPASTGNDVLAVVLQVLSGRNAASLDAATPGLRSLEPLLAVGAGQAGDGETVELATFAIAGQWFGVEAADTRQAAGVGHLLRLPGAARYVRGSAMIGDEAIAVLDLSVPLCGQEDASSARHVVVIRGRSASTSFGVLVQALGPTLTVPTSQVADLPALAAQSVGGLTSRVVRMRPGSPMLTLFHVPRVRALLGAAALQGDRMPIAAGAVSPGGSVCGTV